MGRPERTRMDRPARHAPAGRRTPKPSPRSRGRTLLAGPSLLILLLAFLVASAPGAARADALEDFLAGSAEVGSFALDVLEETVLDDKAPEDIGKDKLKSFVQGKLTDYVRGQITGGSDISEGMGLILNEIYEALNQHRRRQGGVAGMCEMAAINQARSAAFDAKNLRLLRGFGNIWFDLMTSGIKGAPGLAEKLVENIGRTAYESLRKDLEGRIKAWWSAQEPETFKWSKSSGPCTVTITVLWNKKKEKYLFLVAGDCKCERVAIDPPFDKRTITLKSFEIIGGGSIAAGLDTRDPRDPKMRLSAGRPRYTMRADCDCTLPREETRLPPPPPEDETPVSLPGQGTMRPATGARCPACVPLLEEVNRYVERYNALSRQMDELAKAVAAQPRRTAERDRQVEEWNRLHARIRKVEADHDAAFQRFAECEKTECALGQGPLLLDYLQTVPQAWTSCPPCQALADEANTLIAEYNDKVEALNGIARASVGLEFGTEKGNAAYREWQRLKSQVDALGKSVQENTAALSACAARECPGSRWDPSPLWRKATGACQACKDLEQRHNQVTDELNEVITRLNALKQLEREYVQQHGDAWGPGMDGLVDLRERHNHHQLVRRQGELQEQVFGLAAQLRECIRSKCVTVEVLDVKNITGHNPFDRIDPVGEDSAETPPPQAPPPVSPPPASPPPSGVSFNPGPGNYLGTFGCGIGPTNLSRSGSTVTLNPLGPAGSTPFTILNPTTARSVSNNLFILGALGHSCEIRNGTANSFLLFCFRTADPGINCTENFSR